MSEQPDGGPAFETMTLRDWFAGQQAAAIRSNFETMTVMASACGDPNELRIAVALESYRQADAMLAVREAKGPTE